MTKPTNFFLKSAVHSIGDAIAQLQSERRSLLASLQSQRKIVSSYDQISIIDALIRHTERLELKFEESLIEIKNLNGPLEEIQNLKVSFVEINRTDGVFQNDNYSGSNMSEKENPL